MALNRLYFDHQVSLMGAARATTWRSRRAHLRNGREIAAMIVGIQRSLGAKAAKGWEPQSAPQLLASHDLFDEKHGSR